MEKEGEPAILCFDARVKVVVVDGSEQSWHLVLLYNRSIHRRYASRSGKLGCMLLDKASKMGHLLEARPVVSDALFFFCLWLVSFCKGERRETREGDGNIDSNSLCGGVS